MVCSIAVLALVLGAAGPTHALTSAGSARLVAAAEVTPVEKVIKLIDELLKELEADGKAEAKTYEEFACFCKDETMTKSDSIEEGKETIDELSASIAAKTAEKEEMEAAVQKKKAELEALENKKRETEALLSKKTTEYEAAAADLSKAISSLEGAIKTLEASKPTALLQEPELMSALEHHIAQADALNLVDEHQKVAVAAFLQGPAAFLQSAGSFVQEDASVDPSDPGYKFKSQGIIDVCEKLLKEYQEKKAKLDAEWEETKSNLTDLIAKLSDQIDAAKNFIEMGEEKIEQLAGEIADARATLVQKEGLLKDDQLYLKDLTEKCENKAKEYDQRSSARAGEITALSKALDIITNKVQGVEGSRALLQTLAALDADATKSAEMAKLLKDAQDTDFVPSFLQIQEKAVMARNILSAKERELEERKAKAIDFLVEQGHKLNSAALLSLVARATVDPFAKIKGLIQKLIERMLAEAAAEASKKGFCDTELGKAEHDRDYRWSDVKDLNAKLETLEVKLEELKAEIAELKIAIEKLEEALAEAKDLRAQEKAENMKDIADATKGLEATTDAVTILKDYYKQAAKNAVLVQASPVDDDTSASSQGAYKGNQAQGGGIIAMLDVIISDFKRTIKKTTAAEQKAHEEFVLFERETVTSISGKSTAKKLDEEQVVKDTAVHEKAMADLQMNMDLLDAALKAYEELVPTCVDTGMSYAERVAAREAEIEALKKALCLLDGEGVEPDCKK